MEIIGGPNAFLSLVSLLSQQGKSRAGSLIQLDLSRSGFVQVKFLNIGRTLSFSSRIHIDGNLNGGSCHVHLKDLINCLSCCSGYDSRLVMTLEDAALNLTASDHDGSRVDFEIRTVYADEVEALDVSDNDRRIKVVIDSEILATAFLQCNDPAVTHMYFACQVNDHASPLMIFRTRVIGQSDTDVTVPNNLGSEIEGSGEVELIIHGKDVGGVYQFLSSLGSPKTEVIVTRSGIQLSRKLITGNEATLVVLGGINLTDS